MRSAIKRVVMWLYCHGIVPARVVTWLINRLHLRGE